jgi:diguanylate cyclase (GGDEF)-like protein
MGFGPRRLGCGGAAVRWPFPALGPAAALALCGALLGAVGYLDFATGSEPSVAVLYLLPVTLAAWHSGRRWGVVAASGAALAWYAADAFTESIYSSDAYRFWNAAVMLGFFLFAALVTSALCGAIGREHELARTDPLTGLANRRLFLESAAMEIERTRRYGRPFSVAYMDLDRFKEVNDRGGHEAGDRLLSAVGQGLREVLRTTDTLARIGGDEFAVLMPETGVEEALAAGEKICRAVRDSGRAGGDPITASVGVVTFARPPQGTDELLRRADALLYKVKERGRDGLVQEVVGA